MGHPLSFYEDVHAIKHCLNAACHLRESKNWNSEGDSGCPFRECFLFNTPSWDLESPIRACVSVWTHPKRTKMSHEGHLHTLWKIQSAFKSFTAVYKVNFSLTHDAIREVFAVTPIVFYVEKKVIHLWISDSKAFNWCPSTRLWSCPLVTRGWN